MFALDPVSLALAVGISLFAGFVKGAIGFAMPIIMMSAFSVFLATSVAPALMVVPALTGANLRRQVFA